MKRFIGLAFAGLLVACLSGCMALAVVPFANGLLDKDATMSFTSNVKRATLFNATLKAFNAKSAEELSSDRETGTVRGTITVSKGQAAYEVAIQISDDGARSKAQLTAKSSSVYKLDLQSSKDFANDFVIEIERQLGSKLQRL